MLAEHVRTRLARQLCAQHTAGAGYLPIIALTAKWEQAFAEAIVGQGDDRNLAMQPSRLSEFRMPRATARRRSWSLHRAFGPSCAA
jgi:flagellar biosynthesis protein FlhA